MASRYSRYDPDRRSRSPRDRSPDRFDRGSQYGDGDRRRPSAEVRANQPNFQVNRDGFNDGPRREPPRGPRALIDPPSGPRGGYGGDFRGRGRGRGGRVWSRDDSRDRGRDRDIDFRDHRYRDDRSRERERERDRDWRDSREFRSRRSPIGRARSPPRDFRDRDREGLPGPETDRPRRSSRDGGGPLPVGSPSREPPFMSGPHRGGGFSRGRGRGRGDWGSDRGRGRAQFDDRGDRYIRSRSQDGRWGRDRDDRDRGDRFHDMDSRRESRDDRGERVDLFRAKLDARNVNHQDAPPSVKEVSPPPVAPSAPAFGSVPSRNHSVNDGHSGASKPPPTGPRAFTERPPSSTLSGSQEPPGAPAGLPNKPFVHDPQAMPIGPWAPQKAPQRPSSKQWINPNLKKGPESPKQARSQSFAQQRPPPPRQDGFHMDQLTEDKRPRSSDAKAGIESGDDEHRGRAHHSAEPGEITQRSDYSSPPKTDSYTQRAKGLSSPAEPGEVVSSDAADVTMKGMTDSEPPKEALLKRIEQKPKPVAFRFVRLTVPPKPETSAADGGSDTDDDDEDMAEYFAHKIQDAEAKLASLQRPKVPTEVVARFAALSHGSMVKILNEKDDLLEIFGDIGPDGLVPKVLEKARSPVSESTKEVAEPGDEPVPEPIPTDTEMPDINQEITLEPKVISEIPAEQLSDLQPKREELESDATTLEVPPAPLPIVPEPEPTVEQLPEKPLVSPTQLDGRSPEIPPKEGSIVQDPQPMDINEDQPQTLSTPSQVDDDYSTESEGDVVPDVEEVRRFMVTPPLEDLPDFSLEPLQNGVDMFNSLETDPAVEEFILSSLNKIHLDKTAEQKTSQDDYRKGYVDYLNFTLSNDPAAIKNRDSLAIVPPPQDLAGSTTPEPRPEGRTSGRRFATERDLERVLQASMREDEERKERELRVQKEKYRTEKEAVIPDMLWDTEEKQQEHFMDRTGYVSPEKLVSAWHVLPPENNFTEEEAQLFEKRYLELPKQWGKVAEVIPNRDFGTCIQYYYLMKKDLNLKEKLRRQPKKRKKGGRGKQRSSALVSELGNRDGEGEENNGENGENGENRRRPRRAAAPTWGYEQAATETEASTPTGTPGRRGASTAGSKSDQPEKVDGRKRRGKAAKKDEAKAGKPQTLAAAPGPAAGRGRGRPDGKTPTFEFQAGLTTDPRLSQLEQQPGMQGPFSVIHQQQPPPIHPQPVHGVDRSQPPPTSSSMADVMQPPSLRPEPPAPNPQPSMSTFNLQQTSAERKAPNAPSSYWSVSESTDFPALLQAFGSDWGAIAGHMGSKTATMVKNYYIRQKDQGKAEWEEHVREADAKRSRGERRPDPPVPMQTGGRGRRYDAPSATPSRPLAVAPGEANLLPEQSKAPKESGQTGRYPSYGVAIAQAPAQQPPPPQPAPMHPSQQPLSMQHRQPPITQPTSAAMSPGVRPLRATSQPFGFLEREREPAQGRMPLPTKSEMRDQRVMGPGQPLHPVQQPGPMMERERQMIEMRERENGERENRERREREQKERDRERERDYRHTMRPKHEGEAPNYDHYGLGQPVPAHRGEPLSMPPHHSPRPSRSGQIGPGSIQGLLSDAEPPAPLSRPPSSMQHRSSSGPGPELYPQSSTPVPPASSSTPRPEPRKTSNIMSLLNDDPPPAPKRHNDISSTPSRPSPTPPPQSISRPAPPPAPPSGLRREAELPYSPYGRTPIGGPSGVPPLKPPYPSPTSQHPGGSRPPIGLGTDSPASERDYFRQNPYQPNHPSSRTNSPQTTQRYPPPGQPSQMYQSPSGYPSSFGGPSQSSHAASPPPQYPMQVSAPRGREPPQGGRESWPPPTHQPPPSSGWPSQPGKTSQPGPASPWPTQYSAGSSHAGTPTGNWPSGPPQHMSLRDAREPQMYGSHQPSPPQPHGMQDRYGPPPPTSRGPDPGPPPAQYQRYAAPAPGPPREHREMSGRSYTPQLYERGPPQHMGPGHEYQQDIRDMQLRDPRDPRDHRDHRGLRPHEYDRHPQHYGR